MRDGGKCWRPVKEWPRRFFSDGTTLLHSLARDDQHQHQHHDENNSKKNTTPGETQKKHTHTTRAHKYKTDEYTDTPTQPRSDTDSRLRAHALTHPRLSATRTTHAFTTPVTTTLDYARDSPPLTHGARLTHSTTLDAQQPQLTMTPGTAQDAQTTNSPVCKN